jgi:hypothetical protein
VVGGAGVGVEITGATTSAFLEDVEVSSVARGRGRRARAGWGIAIEQAVVELQDVTIHDVGALGLMATGGRLTVLDSTIHDVFPLVGSPHPLGMGLHASWMDSVVLRGLEVGDVATTGVHLQDVAEVVLEEVQVSGVVTAGSPGGDGVVVRQSARSGLPPGAYAVRLGEVLVEDAERMDIVLMGVQASFDVLGATGVYADGEATVEGAAADRFDPHEIVVGALVQFRRLTPR